MLCRLILHCLAAQLCRASPSESLSKSVYSLGKKQSSRIHPQRTARVERRPRRSIQSNDPPPLMPNTYPNRTCLALGRAEPGTTPRTVRAPPSST